MNSKSIASNPNLLFEGAEWDFEKLNRVFEAVKDIADNDLGLSYYPNQIEIISSEQMLDAYSSHGMPLMYGHWSFGKTFARETHFYTKGMSALAYEIVINSNPCISFLMEENTMTMQTLVIAHAGFGHNHFFKNNYLFCQWTDADAILDYLNFAKKFISKCEEEYGNEAVEQTLDSAHALMNQGVFRYSRQPKLSEEKQREKLRRRLTHERETFNDLWRTVPELSSTDLPEDDDEDIALQNHLLLPEENILYFLEKHAPALQLWQRELLRIVRTIAQYFYPQKQTKVMNEGCATFVHHYIMNELHRRGQIDDGALLEFIQSHTGVIYQPAFDDPRYSGFNPYALGFAMMQDIKRICEDPEDEDREWFPSIAGCGDWRNVLKDAWHNYRDESFILQFLSPKLMRDFRLFSIHDEATDSFVEVASIHNERGYRKVRETLAEMFDIGNLEPNIQVVKADLTGDRTLYIQHMMHKGRPLDQSSCDEVIKHIHRLWGYKVERIEDDSQAAA
jgi:stage V sporulation protein R